MTDAIRARFRLDYPGFALDVNLTLPGTGVTAFFGHSGSGKTTLLRCIAGLEKAASGHLEVAGTPWQDGHRFVPPHRRPLGYVFQEASLFPHLTAGGNLRYALRRADRSQPGMSLDDAIDLLGIGALLERFLGQLSGGERQRVAIARALLVRPRLLLMDEPLASLDLPRKLEILPYLEQLRRELALPVIYVSHAADEVARLADYLVTLDGGRVTCAGPLQEVLSRLDLPIALGEDAGSVVEATIAERDSQWQLARACFDGGELWLRDRGHAIGEPVRVRVFARDISLALNPHRDSSIVNILPAVIDEIARDCHGGLVLARLMIGSTPLVARLTRRSVHHLQLARGQHVWAQIKSAAIV